MPPDIHYDENFKVHIEFDQMPDGTWTAEVRGYNLRATGPTCPDALAAVIKLLPLAIGDSRQKE